MAYAERTEVTVAKTKTDIEATLKKYGATAFAFMVDASKSSVAFEARGRRIRFDIRVPPVGGRGGAQLERSIWRALLLCIKAKLESVDRKIETFEEAFLAHVVTSKGRTVYEEIRDQLAITYTKGADPVPLMLPPPSGLRP